MKQPTVAPLQCGGFSVTVAVEASKVPALIPLIKTHGGSDILVTSLRMLVA
jgi:hypothetical protein